MIKEISDFTFKVYATAFLHHQDITVCRVELQGWDCVCTRVVYKCMKQTRNQTYYIKKQVNSLGQKFTKGNDFALRWHIASTKDNLDSCVGKRLPLASGGWMWRTYWAFYQTQDRDSFWILDKYQHWMSHRYSHTFLHFIFFKCTSNIADIFWMKWIHDSCSHRVYYLIEAGMRQTFST